MNQLDKTLMELSESIKEVLIKKHYTISTAESCTGGLLSAYLTSIPGSSAFFNSGIISYSNDAKINLLKVPTDILSKYGAVSKQTAQYMAVGVKNSSHSDLSISITGIAGPDGGSKTKPVGTVCFGFCSKTDVESHIFHFKGNRDEIRHHACKQALEIILKYLMI